jgi:hypothetical protein
MKLAKGVNIGGGVVAIIAGAVVVIMATQISGITGLIGMGTGIVQTVGAVMVGAGIVGMVADK